MNRRMGTLVLLFGIFGFACTATGQLEGGADSVRLTSYEANLLAQHLLNTGSKARAMVWAEYARKQGSKRAAVLLADIMSLDSPDFEEVVSLYKEGTNSPHPCIAGWANLNLGLHYRDTDPDFALESFRFGGSLGDLDAAEMYVTSVFRNHVENREQEATSVASALVAWDRETYGYLEAWVLAQSRKRVVVRGAENEWTKLFRNGCAQIIRDNPEGFADSIARY